MTEDAQKQKRDLHAKAADLIAAERRQRGLTQPELAVAVGVAVATVSNLERGSPVSRTTIDKLAAHLGLTEEVQAIFGEVAHG